MEHLELPVVMVELFRYDYGSAVPNWVYHSDG